MSRVGNTKHLDVLLKELGSKSNPLIKLIKEGGAASAPEHKVENTTGYKQTVNPEKKAQSSKVEQILESSGFIPKETLANEITWFYEKLGIDDTYFSSETAETIASHILSLYGAKISEFNRKTDQLRIDLQRKSADSAVFIHSSFAGRPNARGPQWERIVDVEYLNNATVDNAHRLETYRSTGPNPTDEPEKLRVYFLHHCEFPQPIPAPDSPEFKDIRAVSDRTFLAKASEETLNIYQGIMNQCLNRKGPVVQSFEVSGTKECRIVIGYCIGSTSNFFSALSDLYHYYGLFSSRKYVEFFSNGVCIMNIHLNPLPNTDAPPIEQSVYQIAREVSLIYVLPDNPFLGGNGSSQNYAVQEAAYAYCGWIFAQHFCDRLGPVFENLRNVLNSAVPEEGAVLNDIKLRFRQETFTRQFIFDVIQTFPNIVRLLYLRFALVHYPVGDKADNLRTRRDEILSADDLKNYILKSASTSYQRLVLLTLVQFNEVILKTNFFTPTKCALSFRLDPSFLPVSEYPIKPYGVFMVVGNDFHGFHVRNADTARGGIRIVRSRNKENYLINQRTLFNENYNLARTQHLKNKDIPEGGSKGTILPNIGANFRSCFEKYVDSLIDLLLPGVTPGIKEPIVDLFGKPEILFLGPDENTADFMDWGAEHARSRGAPWWKSFTTGKPAATLGGIPHDKYGMTTLSVREYIEGIIRKLGLKEEEVTKVQTGGPAGDLGSNEILLSKDKTIAMVDGSGVVYDPAGLNRDELHRLATERLRVMNFDPSKLTKDGYRVLVEERDVKLPSGEIVSDGIAFRDNAHFRFEADFFVPCGGRPEAVNIANVADLVNEDKSPKYKYIVEGANLFITKEARLELEKHGVILYPDASANKGGVTSSSKEVLAGLSFEDEEFIANMLYHDGKPTDFYNAYVQDIMAIVRRNARDEFEAIWKEANKTGKYSSVISGELSMSATQLSDEIAATNLFDRDHLRKLVLQDVFPKTLLDKVGMDVLVDRVPRSYLRSAFAAQLSANFTYAMGPLASRVDFFNYIEELFNKPL
ncbi:glutamate dehydrogenase [Malassezia vespertilionis]|uniref:glutamate dehydrogenase n=1 Tax=Malassezia vespertilionis TaxID=2020962 RepID=UPI0024B179D1|nr:glutamate dehydrogenase [Malassezia vespertilionis]WFD07622.1 glutamate dehydrogenase [Malassezia vespertilionis]